MNETIVEIQNLTKIFSINSPPALKDINASIPKGEIVGLVGPDGAGKTTLIRLIAGLLLPTEGSITVAGKDSVKEGEFIHYLSGYMPQKFGLYEDLTVIQNLNLYADLRGVVGKKRDETFEKLLKFTALSPFTKRLAKDLSGGMKQKLGLACALMKRPTLLLLDEPSVGVDPISRRELWKMVEEQCQEGISIIWSTAYLDEAERCNTVLLINEGKLLYQGSPQELTQRVNQRVFKIVGITGSRRQLLSQAMLQKNVMDGIVQGKDVRVVVREKKKVPIHIDELDESHDISVQPEVPRFEDAFIDILGGTIHPFSQLAHVTPPIQEKAESVIVANKLTKKFGSFIAADKISFSVQKGEVFGLLGPNGAGKSTTFKMLCGLLTPSSGNALVNGLDLQIAPGMARSHIGYMAQKFSLYGHLNVRQNLEFFSGIYNLAGKVQREAIEQMVSIFNLKPYLDTSADLLPLGFKQRLALACATMHHPAILFLDEPTSGIDPIVRREFWSHINGLVEKGVTIMITTHFMDEAEYCDRIALIYQGKIIKMETPDSLKEVAITKENPNPTLEDAFIRLIEEYDQLNHKERAS